MDGLMNPVVAIRNRILDKLVDAVAERKARPEEITTENGREFAWIVHERETVFNAVTQERAKLGKAAIPITEVIRVERMAVGHSDYTTKFALYCAELVLR